MSSIGQQQQHTKEWNLRTQIFNDFEMRNLKFKFLWLENWNNFEYLTVFNINILHKTYHVGFILMSTWTKNLLRSPSHTHELRTKRLVSSDISDNGTHSHFVNCKYFPNAMLAVGFINKQPQKESLITGCLKGREKMKNRLCGNFLFT